MCPACARTLVSVARSAAKRRPSLGAPRLLDGSCLRSLRAGATPLLQGLLQSAAVRLPGHGQGAPAPKSPAAVASTVPAFTPRARVRSWLSATYCRSGLPDSSPPSSPSWFHLHNRSATAVACRSELVLGRMSLAEACAIRRSASSGSRKRCFTTLAAARLTAHT